MFATGISTFAGFLGNIFGAEKRTGSLFYSTLVAAIFNIVCFFALKDSIGLHAANVGLALGYVINIALRIVSLKKLYPDFTLQYAKIVALLVLHVPVFYVYHVRALWENLVLEVVLLLVMLFTFRKDIAELLRKMKAKKEG